MIQSQPKRKLGRKGEKKSDLFSLPPLKISINIGKKEKRKKKLKKKKSMTTSTYQKQKMTTSKRMKRQKAYM